MYSIYSYHLLKTTNFMIRIFSSITIIIYFHCWERSYFIAAFYVLLSIVVTVVYECPIMHFCVNCTLQNRLTYKHFPPKYINCMQTQKLFFPWELNCIPAK